MPDTPGGDLNIGNLKSHPDGVRKIDQLQIIRRGICWEYQTAFEILNRIFFFRQQVIIQMSITNGKNRMNKVPGKNDGENRESNMVSITCLFGVAQSTQYKNDREETDKRRNKDKYKSDPPGSILHSCNLPDLIGPGSQDR